MLVTMCYQHQHFVPRRARARSHKMEMEHQQSGNGESPPLLASQDNRHVYRHILPAMTKDEQGINTP